jgi:hypothetical protein
VTSSKIPPNKPLQLTVADARLRLALAPTAERRAVGQMNIIGAQA